MCMRACRSRPQFWFLREDTTPLLLPSGTHSKAKAQATMARLLEESGELEQSMTFRQFGAWHIVADSFDDHPN